VFGQSFIKVCAHFPYPVKIWLNGHEYAKHAARAEGIGFTELDNGFATTEDLAALQRICDTLTSGVIRVFCERWWARLPQPLTDADRAAGYWWEVSMRQVEFSRTVRSVARILVIVSRRQVDLAADDLGDRGRVSMSTLICTTPANRRSAVQTTSDIDTGPLPWILSVTEDFRTTRPGGHEPAEAPRNLGKPARDDDQQVAHMRTGTYAKTPARPCGAPLLMTCANRANRTFRFHCCPTPVSCWLVG